MVFLPDAIIGVIMVNLLIGIVCNEYDSLQENRITKNMAIQLIMIKEADFVISRWFRCCRKNRKRKWSGVVGEEESFFGKSKLFFSIFF